MTCASAPQLRTRAARHTRHGGAVRPPPVGAANRVIIPRHVLPNVLTPIIIVATFSVATNIITEASLSFLGLGVEPTIPTWGSMLADGRAYIGRAWWPQTFPSGHSLHRAVDQHPG